MVKFTVTSDNPTWIEGELQILNPKSGTRARVRFPDGKLRIVHCSPIPYGFSSIPARWRSRHGTIYGYLNLTDGEFLFNPLESPTGVIL